MPRTILYLERNRDGTIGGSYRSLLYLVERLDTQRYRPVVMFYRDHHLIDEFRKAGCKVLLLDYPDAVRLVRDDRADDSSAIKYLRGAALVFQKIINFFHGTVRVFLRDFFLLLRERIHLVHLNNGMFTEPELLLAAKLLGVKTVVHQRGIGPLPRSVKWLTYFVDHVICVSDAARMNLIEHRVPSAKCTTIHNGIDPDKFLGGITRSAQEVRKELGIDEDCPVIGVAGMIRRWKGQLVLVKAMEQISKKHPQARCLIIGGISDQNPFDKAYLEEIQSFIRDHRLEPWVKIIDYQPRIAEYIQAFDIMVHTAIDPEPFSRAVLEGMTLGRAMIATRTGGTPEAIEDGVSGILVPPNDPNALADQIDRLLTDIALRRRLGNEALNRIRDHFMIETNVRATDRLYRLLLHE
ncbi:MAG: glycosyltransferase family 4 protein [Nitrospira sp.]|nr:glycosyltransferase family 4 protein [Nitrospira sp.]